MKLVPSILEDLQAVAIALAPHIHHYGVFGSVLTANALSECGDIDVLWVYDGATYEEMRERLRVVKLALPVATSYRNYSSSPAVEQFSQLHYDFVFVPLRAPDRNFMSMNHGKTLYLTAPFTAWMRPPQMTAMARTSGRRINTA